MNREETRTLLNFLEMSYSGFSVTKEKLDFWHEELQQYDLDDVKRRLNELMSNERYAFVPPLLDIIKSGLTKKKDKVDFSQQIYSCKHCRKMFNDLDETHLHEDRCSAIKYIERQYKRFNLGAIDNSRKYELYNMSEKEFDEKYKKILKYVQEHTNQEYEKALIENIFNPPSMEAAKNFLRGC